MVSGHRLFNNGFDGPAHMSEWPSRTGPFYTTCVDVLLYDLVTNHSPRSDVNTESALGISWEISAISGDGSQSLEKNDIVDDLKEHIWLGKFVSTGAADLLKPVGSWSSVAAVMTKFRQCINTDQILDMLAVTSLWDLTDCLELMLAIRLMHMIKRIFDGFPLVKHLLNINMNMSNISAWEGC